MIPKELREKQISANILEKPIKAQKTQLNWYFEFVLSVICICYLTPAAPLCQEETIGLRKERLHLNLFSKQSQLAQMDEWPPLA